MVRLVAVALFALCAVVGFTGCTMGLLDYSTPQFAGPGEVEYNCACGTYDIVDEGEPVPQCCGKAMKAAKPLPR